MNIKEKRKSARVFWEVFGDVGKLGGWGYVLEKLLANPIPPAPPDCHR